MNEGTNGLEAPESTLAVSCFSTTATLPLSSARSDRFLPSKRYLVFTPPQSLKQRTQIALGERSALQTLANNLPCGHSSACSQGGYTGKYVGAHEPYFYHY